MSRTSDSVKTMADEGSRKAAATTDRVADAAHEAIEGAAARAKDVERQLRTRAAEAGDRFEASRDAVSAQIDETMSHLEAFVRERPLAATGIAFAAGALLFALLRK